MAADARGMRERMLAGELYLADEPALERERRRAAVLADTFNRTADADPIGARRILLDLLGSLGTGSEIRAPLHCDYGYQISIGARVFVNTGLVALDVGRIVIGDDAQIGPHVQLLTPTHPLDPGLRRDKWEGAARITLGANVWLGGGVIVCPGVTIGDDTVVGAGSVVTRDLPAGVLAVGSPARVVRPLA